MTRAIQVQTIGGPDVLTLREVSVGKPGPGEVRLRHTAVGVNYIDIYHRTGQYPLPLPFIPGMEGVGIVDEVGPDVVRLRPGDRVGYAGLIGSYCDTRVAHADRLVSLPDDVPDDIAAAIMLKGTTAQVLLRQVYKVCPGDSILIHAAAGGLGLIMCQWAAAFGATVIGTVSTDEKAAIARAHGCHHPIVTTRENFVERVNQITRGAKLPVVYDSVGKDTFAGSLECLRPRGLMVLSGRSSGPVPAIDPTILAQHGSLFLTRTVVFDYTRSPADLDIAASELFEVIRSGRVKVKINQRFALQAAAEAHRALENRRTTGATILSV